MNAIDVQHIVKKFGDFTAVNGISFAVEEGEIFGLLGPNGAGKSTLIRMMVTLLTPTSGTALINGFDVVKQSDGVRQSIGVIPQAMTSDLELSVEENLIIFAKLYSVPRAKRERLVHAVEGIGSRGRVPLPEACGSEDLVYCAHGLPSIMRVCPLCTVMVCVRGRGGGSPITASATRKGTGFSSGLPSYWAQVGPYP